MANNKVSSLLNVDIPTPKRSNFNLGRVNRFTADVGYVIPCYVEEVIPNSYKRLDIESLIQTNATIAPLMGSFKVKFDAYFVPLRLYHRHLDLNNTDVDFESDFDFHYIDFGHNASLGASFSGKPTSTDGVTFGVAPSSLIDYLGLFPVGLSSKEFSTRLRVQGETFIGYYDIWRNYYCNPHDNFVPYRVQNLVSDTNSSFVGTPEIRYFDYKCLDNFVSYINVNSINSVRLTNGLDSSSTSPFAIDVFDAFCRFVGDYDSRNASNMDASDFTTLTTLYGTSVPLYSYQRNFRIIGKGNTRNYEVSDTSDGLHFGLLPRTYMDDYFNARFKNEFVSYMEEQSTILVENNQFNIAQLRIANRIAKFVDKSIFSDTRFGSWIKAHFGVKTSQKLNIPQFLGSLTSNIVFNDIYATAQTAQGGSVTDNTALGSRSSLGQGYVSNKGSFIEFKATEPGYIMVMFSIIPYVSYFQGIRKMNLKTSFNDVFKPEFDAIGYQDLQKLEMCAIPNGYPIGVSPNVTLTSISVDTYNISMGKQPAWLEYMTAYDESHGLMTKRLQQGSWVLNRPFNPAIYDGNYISGGKNDDGFYTSVSVPERFPVSEFFDPSTYINADYFNNIFAVNKYIDNFQVQVRFYDRTKQPLSKQILPHL